MKRAIALLLAAAMVITILASCGTNEKQAYLNAAGQTKSRRI